MTENLSVEPEVKQVEPKVVAELSSKFVTNINVALYHTEVDIACNFYKQNGKYYDPDGPWLDAQGGVTSLAKKKNRLVHRTPANSFILTIHFWWRKWDLPLVTDVGDKFLSSCQ